MDLNFKNKTFSDYLRIVFDRGYLIIILFLLTETAIFFQNIMILPKYESTVKLQVVAQKEKEITLSKETWYLRGTIDIARTQIELVTNDSIIREVVKLLNLDVRKRPRDLMSFIFEIIEDIGDFYYFVEDWVKENILNKKVTRGPKPSAFVREVERIKDKNLIKVNALPETDIISIKSTDYDPVMAAKMANSVAICYIIQDMKNQLFDLTRIYRSKHPKIVELNSNIWETYAKLGNIAQNKDIEIHMPGNIKIVEKAFPSLKPVSPKKVLNLSLGAAISIFCGLFLCFLIDFIDQTVKHADDIERYLKVSSLGSIPVIKKNEMKKGNYIYDREFFSNIGIEVYTHARKENRSKLLITSTGPEEGKSLLAYNLASVFSKKMRLKVALVDINFVNPRLHVLFNTDNSVGLLDYFRNEKTPDEILKKTHMENVFLLPCGIPSFDPHVIVPHKEVKKLLAFLEKKFDYIIIDGSSFDEFFSLIPFAQEADSIILAIRSGFIRKHSIERFINILRKYDLNILGAVMTFRKYNIPGFIYKRV
ncbi:MAG: hypothetical protein MUD12_04760 [Spirochaetes bacterium]|jgi:capsular polysaccharide biosynthesis protein|nr:hypothetical protein [Spirochaetota bacterium]